jgi:hypothetical protein
MQSDVPDEARYVLLLPKKDSPKKTARTFT